MASYYDPYDSRPRSSRYDDRYARRQDSYRGPAAGTSASSSHQRGGQGQGQGHGQGQGMMETASGYSMPRSYRHSSYQPEYYPPPPPLDQDRPEPPPARAPPPQRRNTWPPPVTCEDEAVSLAKEAGTAALLKDIGRDEAQSRGTVDQDPIVQDVEEFINQFERRFVLSSEAKRDDASSTGMPTPPTSEDERARKMRRRPSRLQTDLDQRAPEVQGRTASPYAFSQPTKLRQPESSSSSQYLSPTTATPTESRRRENRYSTSKAPSPRREPGRRSPGSRPGSDYFSAGYSSEQAIADDGWDPRDVRGLPRNRRDIDERPGSSRGTDVVDFATPSSNAQPIRRMDLDTRRNTDSASTLPTLPVDKSRRPSPFMTAAAMTGAAALSGLGSSTSSGIPSPADLPLPRSREPSYASSRGVSPAASIGAEPSPPRSARMSADYSRGYANGSAPSSGPESASVSRPASPPPRTPAEVSRTPGGLPKTDLDWSTLLAANAARKSKPPSRLATSMRQDSIPDPQQYSQPFTAPPARHATTLPYPDRATPHSPVTWMPSAPEDQYYTSPTAAQPSSSKLGVPSASEARNGSRAASPAGSHTSFTSNASHTSTSSKPSRPSMVSRHTMTGASPTVEERPSSSHRRVDSFTASSQTRKELTALLKKGLPECPRPEPVSGYDDWYTVIGAPALIFCPDCVDNVFERTLYRPSIRRLPQLNFSSKVTCAFGSSPWLRLAWLLTLQQHRTDLTLLKDLAEVEETSEPCPGSREAVRSWYGLRDPEGYFIRDFRICYADVRKIERLLPTLNGFFVRLPQRASYDKHICAIRADSNRFSIYLDALIATHERAMASRKGADSLPFIKLVEHKMRIRECARDNMLLGGLWHFVPNIPSLTVCEDCYESVVEPEVRKNSDVAMRFNRTVQPVYGEGTTGTSCQLYSPRMRRIFARACQDNDIKYLAKKAKERREAELRLQERYRDVKRTYERLMRDGSLTEDDEWRLNRESGRITEEWQDRWE